MRKPGSTDARRVAGGSLNIVRLQDLPRDIDDWTRPLGCQSSHRQAPFKRAGSGGISWLEILWHCCALMNSSASRESQSVCLIYITMLLVFVASQKAIAKSPNNRTPFSISTKFATRISSCRLRQTLANATTLPSIHLFSNYFFLFGQKGGAILGDTDGAEMDASGDVCDAWIVRAARYVLSIVQVIPELAHGTNERYIGCRDVIPCENHMAVAKRLPQSPCLLQAHGHEFLYPPGSLASMAPSYRLFNLSEETAKPSPQHSRCQKKTQIRL